MPRHKATPKKHENDFPNSDTSACKGKIGRSCQSDQSDEDEEQDEDVSVSCSDSKDNDQDDLILDLSLNKCRPKTTPDAQDSGKQVDKSCLNHQQNRDQKDNPKNRTNNTKVNQQYPSSSTSKTYADSSTASTSACTASMLDLKSFYSAAALTSRYFPSLLYHQTPLLAPSASAHSSGDRPPPVDAQPSQSDCLSKLSNLVSKVGKSQSPTTTAIGGGGVNNGGAVADAAGNSSAEHTVGGSPGNGLNFQELWWRFVKKEENAEMKRLNEAKQIFTCLQCQASFQTMDQLVKHMETTQHYANIPKHYSWSLQYARQKMRQMKMKMKYSDKMMYFCFLCQAPFTEPVHVHFNYVHSMHNPAENMKFVQIISVVAESSKCATSSSTSTSGKRKAPATASTTAGSDYQQLSPHNSRSTPTTPFSTCSRLSSPEKQHEFPVKTTPKRQKIAAADSSGYGGFDADGNNKSLNLLSKMEAFVHNAVKHRSK